MFTPYDQIYDRTTTVLDESDFLFRHSLVTEENHLLSDQKDQICDRQRDWMNRNANGLDFSDKKNFSWLVETLKAHTQAEIIPNLTITWSYD